MIDWKIIEWFEKYHIWEDKEKMQNLYEDLIDEELQELQESMLAWDIIEIYDALWDLYWVVSWAAYYYLWTHFYDRYYDWMCLLRKQMGDKFKPVMETIIQSNFTKEVFKQNNEWKIGKWPNFIKPDIKWALWLQD